MIDDGIGSTGLSLLEILEDSLMLHRSCFSLLPKNIHLPKKCIGKPLTEQAGPKGRRKPIVGNRQIEFAFLRNPPIIREGYRFAHSAGYYKT